MEACTFPLTADLDMWPVGQVSIQSYIQGGKAQIYRPKVKSFDLATFRAYSKARLALSLQLALIELTDLQSPISSRMMPQLYKLYLAR